LSRQSTHAAALLVSAAVMALAVGLHGVKSDPAPAQASAPVNPAAAAFKSPSLWQIVSTDDRQPTPQTSRMCINAVGGFASLFKGIKPDSRCPQSISTLAGGARVVEIQCRAAPGAKWSDNSSTRIEASSDAKTIHQHSERQFPNLDPPLNRMHVNDAVMTYLGDCPAPMRSDQLMLLQGADGKFVDPLSELTKLLKSAAAAASPQPAPKP